MDVLHAIGLTPGACTIEVGEVVSHEETLRAKRVRIVFGAPETKEEGETATQPTYTCCYIDQLEIVRHDQTITCGTFEKTVDGVQLYDVTVELREGRDTVLNFSLRMLTLTRTVMEGRQIVDFVLQQSFIPVMRLQDAPRMISIILSVLEITGHRWDLPTNITMLPSRLRLDIAAEAGNQQAPGIRVLMENLTFEIQADGRYRGIIEAQARMVPNFAPDAETTQQTSPMALGPIKLIFSGTGRELQITISDLDFKLTVPELLSLFVLLNLGPPGTLAALRMGLAVAASDTTTSAAAVSAASASASAAAATASSRTSTRTFSRTSSFVCFAEKGAAARAAADIALASLPDSMPHMQPASAGMLPSDRPMRLESPTYAFQITLPMVTLRLVSSKPGAEGRDLMILLKNLQVGKHHNELHMMGDVTLYAGNEYLWQRISTQDFPFLGTMRMGRDTELTIKLPGEVRVGGMQVTLPRLWELFDGLQTNTQLAVLVMAERVIFDLNGFTMRISKFCFMKHRDGDVAKTVTTCGELQVDHESECHLPVLLATDTKNAKARQQQLEEVLAREVPEPQGTEEERNAQLLHELFDIVGDRRDLQFAASLSIMLGTSGWDRRAKMEYLLGYFARNGVDLRGVSATTPPQQHLVRGYVLTLVRMWVGFDRATMAQLRNNNYRTLELLGLDVLEFGHIYAFFEVQEFATRYTYATANDTSHDSIHRLGVVDMVNGAENAKATIPRVSCSGFLTAGALLAHLARHYCKSLGFSALSNPALGNLRGAAKTLAGGVAGLVTKPLRGALEGGLLGLADGLLEGAVDFAGSTLTAAAAPIEGVVSGVTRAGLKMLQPVTGGMHTHTNIPPGRLNSVYRQCPWMPSVSRMAGVAAQVALTPVVTTASGVLSGASGVFKIPLRLLFWEPLGIFKDVAGVPLLPAAGAAAAITLGVSTALNALQRTVALPQDMKQAGDTLFVATHTGDVIVQGGPVRARCDVPMNKFSIPRSIWTLLAGDSPRSLFDLHAAMLEQETFFPYAQASEQACFAAQTLKDDNHSGPFLAVNLLHLDAADCRAIVASRSHVSVLTNDNQHTFPKAQVRATLVRREKAAIITLYDGQTPVATLQWQERDLPTDDLTFHLRLCGLRALANLQQMAVPINIGLNAYYDTYLLPLMQQQTYKRARHQV